MLHMPSPMLMVAASGPAGQQLFLSSGSFIVPAGVSSLSAVCIGRGGDGSFDGANAAGGGGGALAYLNNVAVTPGETLTVTFNSTSVTILRGSTVLVRANNANLSVGGTVGAGTGFRGGDGGTIPYNPGGFFSGVLGGGAGGYTSAGQHGSASGAYLNRGGGGSSPLGGGPGANAGTSANANGAAYGGGGGNDSDAYGSIGGPGVARIIWGEGRAFPNTNTGDV